MWNLYKINNGKDAGSLMASLDTDSPVSDMTLTHDCRLLTLTRHSIAVHSV